MGYFILTSRYHLRTTMKLYITLFTSLPILCGNGHVTISVSGKLLLEEEKTQQTYETFQACFFCTVWMLQYEDK